jgi:putative FmdB family regulatory protein
MPIYEYACRKCDARVEILQKLSDKPLVKCKECGGRLEKQWSQTGFQFKGSGWYVTDYARKGADKKGEGASEATSETKSDSKSDTKGDTKSDAKTESTSNTTKSGDEKKTPKATSSSKSASKD